VVILAAGLYWVTERDVMLATAVASGTITLLLILARHLGFLVISRKSLAEKSRELSANARLDIALNNISQGLCFFDGNQRLIVCNKRFVEMYDLPDGRVQPGTPLMEIVDLRFEAGSFPAMSKAEYLAWRTSVAISNEPSDTIVELKNGKVFEIRHRPMSDGGWVATHEDITQRVRSEREARDAHKRLIEAFDVVPEGLVYFDKDDRYVLWNDRYSELYGDSTDLIVAGARFEDVLRAGLAKGQYPEAAGREEAWLADRLEKHDQIDSIHEQQLTNGRWVRVEERRTSSGERIGVRIDITDLKRREASFRLLFVNNPVPMWVYDLKTLRFLAVNSSAIEHYGYSEQQFLSMSIGISAPAMPINKPVEPSLLHRRKIPSISAGIKRPTARSSTSPAMCARWNTRGGPPPWLRSPMSPRTSLPKPILFTWPITTRSQTCRTGFSSRRSSRRLSHKSAARPSSASISTTSRGSTIRLDIQSETSCCVRWPIACGPAWDQTNASATRR
jgi:PAS domain-containing protein